MDPASLAATAIAAALPYVAMIGTEAAKGAAGAAGKSVWDWVKGKLTSEAGKEAVKDLETSPQDPDNRKAAEAALSKVLKSDPNALLALADLLDKAGVTTTTQIAKIVGHENVTSQASGSGITISVGRSTPRK